MQEKHVLFFEKHTHTCQTLLSLSCSPPKPLRYFALGGLQTAYPDTPLITVITYSLLTFTFFDIHATKSYYIIIIIIIIYII